MSLEKLQFTKDWKSPEDFPTYQSDETAVREDMQQLHDETRDFINDKVLPYVDGHMDRTDNPHKVTAAQSGAVATGDTFDVALKGGGVDDIYPEVSHHAQTVKPTSLDDLAWEGMSYREIFEGSNAFYIDPEKSMGAWLDADGTGTLKFRIIPESVNNGDIAWNSKTCTGSRSLRMRNNNISTGQSYRMSSYRRYRYEKDDQVYVAAMVQVESIATGSSSSNAARRGCGLDILLPEENKSIYAVAKNVTSNFEVCSALAPVPVTGNYNLRMGCLGGFLEAVFYVERPTIINLSNIFDNPPDKDTMDLLFRNYVALCGKNSTADVEIAPWETGDNISFTDDECVTAFVDEMNRKAADIGMTHSYFISPSGALGAVDDAVPASVSTAGDMARMGAAAIGYPEIGRIWRKARERLGLGGTEQRLYWASQIIDFPELESGKHSEEEHPYLGAKGGSSGDYQSVVAVTLSDDGKLLVHAVTRTEGAGEDAGWYPILGRLTDLAERALGGEDVSAETVGDETLVGAVTLLVPHSGTWLLDEYDYRVLYQTGENVEHRLASTTKILTAMVALDWCPNIRTQSVVINPRANVGNSGDRFLMGQTMSLEAAMQGMLMFSSNSTAHAIAKTVGEMILRSKAERNEPPVGLIANATGSVLELSDSLYGPIRELKPLYGKTTRTGTPTPESPATLSSLSKISIAGAGAAEQVMLLNRPGEDSDAPSGYMQGLPVPSGGNYTDATGQQWVCDEVDFKKGVYIQRVNTFILDGSDDETYSYSVVSSYPVPALALIYLPLNSVSGSNRFSALSDRFTTNPTGANAKFNYGVFGISGTQKYALFGIEGTDVKVSENVRTWFKEHPTKVIYPLAEPIVRPLSDVELSDYRSLHTNYPTTTITNDAGVEMTVKYSSKPTD